MISRDSRPENSVDPTTDSALQSGIGRDSVQAEQDLRHQAESTLSSRKQKTAALPTTASDPRRLVHELEVHQIELEMQNDELVHSRAQAETLLRRYTDLYDFSPVGYFSLAPDGAIHQVNLAGANLLRVERSALNTRRFGVFVSVESRAIFSDFLEKIFSTNSGKETCEVALQKDGRPPQWVHIEATRFEEGLECLAVVSDVTERQQASQALSASEVRYRRLFEAAQDGILILDAETGMIVDVNPFLIDMLGYSHESFLAKPVWSLGIPGDAFANRENFKELQRNEYIRYDDLPLEAADGRRIAVEFVSNVYLADLKKVIQCNIRDITDRKRGEESIARLNRELLRKNSELEQIVYVASHDLRSPLVNVQGFCKELENSLADLTRRLVPADVGEAAAKDIAVITGQDIPEALGFIRTSVARMDSLLSGLLKLSRLGRSAISIQVLSMDKIVGDVLKNFEYTCKQKGAEVQVSAPLPSSHGDPEQMSQVFSNLVDNALKYLDSNRPGRIVISGSHVDGNAVYCVEDNGIGMAPQHCERVFEIFHRLDPRNGEGEGLGLTIVRRSLDMQGGRVWVESEAGRGSKFFVSLPVGKS